MGIFKHLKQLGILLKKTFLGKKDKPCYLNMVQKEELLRKGENIPIRPYKNPQSEKNSKRYREKMRRTFSHTINYGHKTPGSVVRCGRTQNSSERTI